jgi:16S rRNA (guanine527-N7)-methyltransferase
MIEQDARQWIIDQHGAERMERVERFLALVAEENEQQNLIAPSTIATIWERHALDSAQLLKLAPAGAKQWIDVGTGGGFPGMVVALLFDGKVALVEPRRRRADFLERAADACELTNVAVYAAKIEQVDAIGDVISARAVASVEKLLQATAHCATPATRWILPRGRLDPDQLNSLRSNRRMMFHVEHSLTDPASSILVVEKKR